LSPQEASAELRALARTLRDKVDTRSPEYDAVKIRFSTMLAIAYMDAVNDYWDEQFSRTPEMAEERRVAINTCRKEHVVFRGDAPERWIMSGAGVVSTTVCVIHGDSCAGYPKRVPVLDGGFSEARPLWTYYIERLRKKESADARPRRRDYFAEAVAKTTGHQISDQDQSRCAKCGASYEEFLDGVAPKECPGT
jgi:hypothetical protein